jgi:dolichyl-phosphate-mannose--protein O-mannosyl transferase
LNAYTFIIRALLGLSVLLGSDGSGAHFVTCGSVIKLVNKQFNVRLHSHDVKYGSGSGQQSVTGTDIQEDVNSHWAIKGTVKSPCLRGEPVECGQEVRLEHTTTKRNLHSHLFSSPLSRNQEVSAFGEEGEGDSGDNWVIVCEGTYWERKGTVMFRHIDTDMYLGISDEAYGRPIHGQREVCSFGSPFGSTKWETGEGMYILQSDFDPLKTAAQRDDHIHTEL